MPYFGDGANLSGVTGVVKKIRVNNLTGQYEYGISQSGWQTALQIPSFTPASTNSRFVIIVTIASFVRWYGSGSAWGQMKIVDLTDDSYPDGISTNLTTADNSGSHRFTILDTKGGTTARNYALQLASGNNSGRARVQNCRMMVIELDQSA